MFYKTIKAIAGLILRPFFRIKVYGIENVPTDGKLVLCSNHASNWDPIFISVGIPRQIHWMAKKELFQNKALSFLIKKLEAFPVDREGTDINAIKNALRVLKDDKVLGIFPEGTRVDSFDLKNAKHGAVLLSIRSKSSILPVYIESNYKLFSKVNIYIGETIDYSKELDHKPSSEDYNKISKDLLSTIYSLKLGGK